MYGQYTSASDYFTVSRTHASVKSIVNAFTSTNTVSYTHLFDMIIGMDDRNIEDLMERAPDLETEKKIHRMTDYCRTKVADYVPDP